VAERKTTKDEAAVLAKIASWPDPYRGIGERLHEVVMASVPELKPKLWYGAPGYGKGGPTLCFFRHDDGTMSFGLTEKAHLSVDEGATDLLIPSAWVVTELDRATEERIAAIVRKGAG
jgi:hypothetical protein